jgi:hypothetical protein
MKNLNTDCIAETAMLRTCSRMREAWHPRNPLIPQFLKIAIPSKIFLGAGAIFFKKVASNTVVVSDYMKYTYVYYLTPKADHGNYFARLARILLTNRASMV